MDDHREYSKEEVAKHRSSSDAWIIIDNTVYAVSKYLSRHPGGTDAILAKAGGDATKAFQDIGHSGFAKRELAKFAIGTVAKTPSPVKAPADKASTGIVTAPAVTSSWEFELVVDVRRRENHDSVVVKLVLPEGSTNSIHLEAGQHVMVNAEILGIKVARPYTPVAVSPTSLILLVKVVPGGKVSSYLGKLKRGAKVLVEGPCGGLKYLGNGVFSHLGELRPQIKSIGLVCGGSGLTVLWQIACAVLRGSRDRTRVSMLYANKTADDILMKKQIDNAAKAAPDSFSIYYTLSDAPAGWDGGVGRVTPEMIERCMPRATTDLVLVCGPDPMNRAIEAALHHLGFSAREIHIYESPPRPAEITDGEGSGISLASSDAESKL